MRIEELPRRTATQMAAVVALLILASIAAEGWRDLLQRADHPTLVRFFDADLEHNLPTWYSSAQLFLAALLLGEIAVLRRLRGATFVRHWTWLAFIFAYLATDESLVIHEQLTPFMRAHFHVHGFLYRAWVIPVGLLLVAFVLAYLPFLGHLTRRMRILFIVSGAIYVGGAMGVEMVNTELMQNVYGPAFGWRVVELAMQNVEELMEMGGIVLFVYTLLHCLIAETRLARPD
ncbi:MAG TPA: hypothetical protein VFW66_09895 [Gemmatimonadales bacterium]|nr:hypothetical protein [Gemmatimonadales bacterium]